MKTTTTRLSFLMIIKNSRKFCPFANGSIFKSFILALLIFIANCNTYGQTNMSLYPNVSIHSNSPVFRGDILRIMATGGTSYQWAGPNNFTSNAKCPVLTSADLSMSGIYYCTITDDPTGMTVYLSLNVEVNSRQTTNIVADPFICEHSNLKLFTPTQSPSYHWTDLTSGWSDWGQTQFENDIMKVSMNGIHTIQCEVIVNGVPKTETITVEVINCCTTTPVNLLYNTNISTAIVTNPCVILGDVKIDVDYTFLANSEIILLPQALMEVNAGLTLKILNNSIVKGCEQLWEGIYLHDKSSIILKETVVKEGYNAIMVDGHDGTLISLDQSHFVNNGNSISIQDVTTITLPFARTHFQSTNLLLPYPLTGLASFSGIYAANSTVNFFNPELGTSNELFDMENGIFAVGRMYLTVPSLFAKFYNFNTVYSQPENPGHGIYIEGIGMFEKTGTNDPTFVDFNNCREGIEITGIGTNGIISLVNKNYMENMNIGVKVNLNSNVNTSITTNTIFAKTNGVRLNFNNPVNGFEVDNNNITLNAPEDGWVNSCILINEGPLPPITGGYMRIRNNLLTVNNGFYGICSTGANGTEILENTIYLNQPDFNRSGIRLTSCSYNMVMKDTVIGINPALGNIGLLLPQGLTVESTTNSFFQCNYYTDLLVGAGFYENCNPAQIIRNHFNNHHLGLYYNQNANTGAQMYHCNIWTGSYNQYFDSKKARNDGTPPLNSIYYVNTSPANMDPVPSVLPPQFWFFETQGSGAEMNPCDGGGGTSFISGLNEIDSIIAKEGLSYENHITELQWQDGRSLLKTLNSNDSLLLNNTLMQQFSDSVQSLSLGLFQGVDDLKKDIYYISPETISLIKNLNINIKILNDSLRYIDSLLSAHPFNSNNPNLLEQKTSIGNSMILLINQKQMIIENNRLITDNTINMVIAENGILPASEQYEQNEKTYNDIFLKTIARGNLKFTSSQKSDLLNIASQCSLTGGKAVNLSRSLYSLITDTLFDDKNLCLQVGIIKSSNVKTDTKSDIDFHYFPNPVLDNFTITWNSIQDAKGDLSILNSVGKIIREQTFSLANGSQQVNVKDIQPGVYFLQINVLNKKETIGKLVIIK